MRKRVLSLALAGTLCLGLTVPAYAASAQTFTDVPPNHWAYSYIQEAAADGAVNGIGNGRFDPDGILTMAEWSCILARAFYGNEVEAKAKTNWFNREIEVLWEHGIYSGWGTLSSIQFSAPASRTAMAVTVANLIADKGITADASKVEAAKAQITDLNDTYPMYHNAIATVWVLGIINGTGGGTFDGNGKTERAAAATVYGRVKNVLAGAPSGSETPPETPTPPATASLVGTMSSTRLNLSKADLESHAPVIDFWAQQPMEIRNISDRDAFNAACQTLKDSKMITTQGEMVRTRNVYYHYAMATPVSNEAQKNVIGAMGSLSGCGGSYGGYGSSFLYFTLAPLRTATTSAPRFASAIAQINANPGMTDIEKANVCITAVCTQLDYLIGGGASWDDGGTKGDCTEYARMLNQILAAAGIPSINVAGTVARGGHSWVQVKLDGQWYIMDGTITENNPNTTVFTFAEHEAHYNYSGLNDRDGIKVARALIDAAYPTN